MPYVDKKTGELVLRIVYDGPAEAGKTTNIQRLSTLIAIQRRGALASPGTEGERTAFFDWLDFAGGFLDGRRVRCQLVSVPGQPELLHRRRYLLESADAIVFVADARPDELASARRNLDVTRRIVDGLDSPVPVGVVVQANKQDLPNALSAPGLTQGMELPPGVAVVASSAANGDGVMQTFVLAVRLATDRVRALMAAEAGEDPGLEHETPDALFAAMQQLASEQPAASPLPAPVPSAPVPAARPEPEPVLAPAARPVRRPNLVPAGGQAGVKAGIEISAGHLWPPVRGRAMLANAASGGFEMPEFVQPWGAPETFELITSNGWVIHSAARWSFPDEGSGRLALLALARRQIVWGELVPETRALFLSEDADSWRLWVLSHREPTFREIFTEAVTTHNPELLQRLVAVAGAARERFNEAMPGATWIFDLDQLAVGDGRGAVLAVNEVGAVEPRPPLPSQLHQLARDLAGGDLELLRWIEAHGVVPG